MIQRREIGWIEYIKRFLMKKGFIAPVKKYVLCPTMIGGKKKGFYVSSKELASFYNVEMSECLVRVFSFREHEDEKNLLPLSYRASGDYRKLQIKGAL